MTTPRVFVTDLHAYNCGDLHGRWVDAIDVDVLTEAVREVLASSPHPGGEEWFLSDYDGFGPYRVGEYAPLTKVAEIGAAIDEHGIAVGAWLSLDEDNFKQLDRFEDFYIGETDDPETYGIETYEEVTLSVFKSELKHLTAHDPRDHLLAMFERSIEPYINTTAAGHDCVDDVEFVECDGTTYVFRSDA